MHPLRDHPVNLMTALRLVWVPVLCFAASVGAHAEDLKEETAGNTFFSKKIEPILKEHCFACHSHAAGEMEGGLTLDSRSGWLDGGDRGSSIIPGKPEESLLIKAIRRGDPELSMPPDEKLPKAAIDLLVAWIERGAPDPRKAKPVARKDATDWWSLHPLKRPEIPKPVNNTVAETNPIDAFLLRRLQAIKVAPTDQADRRTFIRRVMFDLHGLPPTPGEVAAFVADPDPLACEKLIDRLLASPRYGERWARHWLDTIHFADTHGCEHDVFRPNAWRYRDYVIESLNADTPWPRFIREQLAADRFFPDEPKLTIALGFIAAGPLELSRAGTAPVTFDYLDRDDMVTQTMAAFASTTANCARCHQHKFDPISQEDYYALQAVFAGVGKGDVEFDEDPDVAAQRRRWEELAARTTNGDVPSPLEGRLLEIVTAWEDKLGKQPAVWNELVPEVFVSSDGATLKRVNDNSLVVSGARPDKDTYTITAPTELKKLVSLRLDVISDESLPMQGPGRADNGNLHLTEFEAYLFEEDATESVRLKIKSATADWDQEGWTIAHALDGDLKTAWGIYPKVGSSHRAVFELETPVDLKPLSKIVVVLKQLHGGSHLIGKLKLFATDAEGAAVLVLPDQVGKALQLPHDQRSQEQQSAIDAFVLNTHAKQQLDDLPAKSSVYAVSDMYSHAKKLDQPITPKAVHVLRRGDIHQPGEIATPGALSAITVLNGRFKLDDPNDEASRRAALADWLAAADNPLTWRSIVNRVWSYHFGRGICDTPNDFGRMGGTPSHPELLDWLAVWFRDDAKGSLKQLHRLILLSAAYQQQSATATTTSQASSAHAVDSENRLLWRMNRRQLDAESFRDAVLQISGRLDLTMGGPGIQQFTQSAGAQATPKLDYEAFDWSKPEGARRSIYRVVWRGIADPFMESLDFPDLGLLAPKRGTSVSALQALALYNNDFVLHHSKVLAERLKEKHGKVAEQIIEAVRLIYLREPTADERTMLTAFCERRGLAATCRVLLNSNEFIFVD